MSTIESTAGAEDDLESKDEPLDGQLPGYCHLPWPPSVNHIWRQARRKVYMSANYRSWRNKAVAELKSAFAPIDGWVEVIIFAVPPDKRRRDLDNVIKPILDAMVAAGITMDDSCSQVRGISIQLGRQKQPGCYVHIHPYSGSCSGLTREQIRPASRG